MRDNDHKLTRVLFSFFTAASLAGGGVGCSDDKAEHAAPGASAGSEDKPQAGNRIDKAHADFKEAVQPAAGWVDEKSHRAADELNTAASRVKGAFEEDEPEPAVAKEPIKAEPAPATTTAPASGTTSETTKD